MPHQPTLMEKRQRDKLRQARAAEAAASPRPAEPTSSGSGHGRGTGGRARPSGRSGDRWAVLNAFVDGGLAHASEAEVRVWLVLYREVKPDGLARAGMTDLARRTGMTRRGVVNAVRGLKRRRLIEVAVRGSINGSTNAYRVLNANSDA